jgi:SAM-dependent methyltransferase
MKPALLQYLCCPVCGGELTLTSREAEQEEILEGELTCAGCAAAYPVLRGVPRFAGEMSEPQARTAEAFGYEWTRYDELAARYRKQFLAPVEPEFMKDRVVLEGGCGKGRHTALVAEFGARAVLALDLSDAVDAAFRNTRALPNAHVIQADIYHPPVKRLVDYAFSIGVLHHLPDPEGGFRALVGRVRPGGHVSAWVYGREGNGWIVHGVTPLREHVTSHLPYGVLDKLSAALTVPLFAATRLLYAPTARSAFGRRLPYGDYLRYIAPFPFREQRSIVFDHLVAPTAFYLRHDEFAGWFERAGLEQARIEPHNGNSWRGFARVPPETA